MDGERRTYWGRFKQKINYGYRNDYPQNLLFFSLSRYLRSEYCQR
jgi:hypothetical protein